MTTNIIHRCQYDPFPHKLSQCGALSRGGMTDEEAVAYSDEMHSKGYSTHILENGADTSPDAGVVVWGAV